MHEELALSNPELLEFIQKIQTPYNILEFKRLRLAEEEDFLDPITGNIMNFPVTLHGKTFDLDTLDLLDTDYDGKRSNPFTREKFTFKDISPNKELYEKIRSAISAEIKSQKTIIKSICLAVMHGDIDKLQQLLNENTKIDVNDPYEKGYTALHYACEHKQIGCAKYLLEIGADPDAPAGNKKTTPFGILKTKDVTLVEQFKKHLVDFLQKKIIENDTASNIRYAKLLLNGNTIEQNIPQAIILLCNAGDMGDVNGYILCGDIHQDGLCNVKTDYSLAIDLYNKAISKYNDIRAKIKRTIMHLTYKEVVFFEFTGLKIEEIANLVNSHDPDALFLYALMYEVGLEVSISNYKHNKYLRLSAKYGHMLAQYHYALHAMNVLKNNSEARKYFKTSADQGYTSAKYNYAICCIKGLGMDIDITQGLEYLKLAADQNDPDAQDLYAAHLANGNGVEKDTKLAVHYFKLAADQGYAQAQYNYATCCQNGTGIEKNPSEASKYFKFAADQGNDSSQTSYGVQLLNGNGVRKDPEAAVHYFRMAINKGCMLAQFNYAICCQDGLGIEKNPYEAAKYFKLAADQGFMQAQLHYGTCCYKGLLNLGTNLDEAAKYLKLAADQGCMPAQFNYSLLCNRGVNEKPSEVAKYSKLAADQGHIDAQRNYATCCEKGYGISHNLEEAIRYYQLAFQSSRIHGNDKVMHAAAAKLIELSQGRKKSSVTPKA